MYTCHERESLAVTVCTYYASADSRCCRQPVLQAAPSVLTIIRAFLRAHTDCHNGHNGQIVNQLPVTMWQRNNMGKDIAKKIVDLTKKDCQEV